jgi:isopentenyl-diphosphate delta-isomerase
MEDSSAPAASPGPGAPKSPAVVPLMDDEARDTKRGVQATEADTLILVDEADREIGHLGKDQCHAGAGILHRAFSILIFNAQGELLLQQRSAGKRLWPLYWSNSCCSHPRRAETLEAATARRLEEELGLVCPLRFLFKFQYQAQFDPAGAENELCSVYIGRSGQPLRVNESEIHAWRWVSLETLGAEMAGPGQAQFTPWFKIEWQRIWREHRADVLALLREAA